MNTTLRKTGLLVLLAASLFSCRKDKDAPQPENIAVVKGLYLLNEGSWGNNNATLDFYDYPTSTYKINI